MHNSQLVHNLGIYCWFWHRDHESIAVCPLLLMNDLQEYAAHVLSPSEVLPTPPFHHVIITE